MRKPAIVARRPAETTTAISGVVITLLLMVGFESDLANAVAVLVVAVIPTAVTAWIERTLR